MKPLKKLLSIITSYKKQHFYIIYTIYINIYSVIMFAVLGMSWISCKIQLASPGFDGDYGDMYYSDPDSMFKSAFFTL